MSDLANRALLPAGLRDLLPPDAAFEAEVVHGLTQAFAAHGYERVKPPLIEFEESLFAGSGAATADQTFRVMDPVSQRMMGLRADMTVQIARIAATRLANAPRPLRLAYAGQVLRVKGTQLRPERQVGQAGIELIGCEAATADAEVMVLAARALEGTGLTGLSVDVTMPSLVDALLAEQGPQGDAAPALREALDHKDTATVAQLGGAAAPVLNALIAAAGPAERALAQMDGVALGNGARQARDRLKEVVSLVRRAAPGLKITVDPVERRGFEYYTGVSFAMFSRSASVEIARGGRYLVGGTEPATGATVDMDALVAALPAKSGPRRVFVPFGTPDEEGRRLRDGGMVTVAGLEPAADDRAEARRLNCGYVLIGGKLAAVDEGGGEERE